MSNYPKDIWLDPKWEKKIDRMTKKVKAGRKKFNDNKVIKPRGSILDDLHII